MKRIVRVVLLVMLFAALPLRGYPAALMALCGGFHDGGTAAAEHVRESGDEHRHEPSDNGGGILTHAASVCSVCASCCASAGLAPRLIQGVMFQPPGAFRIPFLDYRFSGFVPESLDRPPLVS
ncbi:MAG: hypothetical protein WAO95_10245 [Burkholderiales bacterium]